MAFNLDQVPHFFHYEVEKLQSNNQPIPIMAKFRAFKSSEQVDEVLNRIRAIDVLMAAKPDAQLNAELIAICREVFLGWTNPEERPDLWVTAGADSQPVEPTTENLEAFIHAPSVAYGLLMAFVDQQASREAQLGNSGPSRGNGFKALAKANRPA
jgi:hypothetical protein